MTGKIVGAVILTLMGIWLLASAMTEKGLLPSGHGTGWFSEIVIGIGCLLMAVVQLQKVRLRS
jgi:hypothetical protein